MNKIRLLLAMLLVAAALPAQRVPGRYIVEMETEPVAEHVARIRGRGRLLSAEATTHRRRIRGEQQAMRNRLQQRQTKVLGGIDTVGNALFVEVSDDAAARLSNTPGVKRVIPVRQFRLLLDRAVMLHKVTDVWNRIGAEHAGEGMKIAIIDTGIDSRHAGFQDPLSAAPDGFPKASTEADLAYTNGKVIVARSYVSLLPYQDPDSSPRDHMGHGTALAMIAAGVRTTAPLATIMGVAPRAYLGNYKIFGTPGYNDYTTDDAILKALDDAVADGMDVVNLSLGSIFAPRLAEDPDVQAIERATKAGVIVVAAAGNEGPELNTISSPATAPSAIAVGASTNSRTFGFTLEVAGLGNYPAVPDDAPAPSTPVIGPLVDVETLDQNGLACTGFPAGSLTGKVTLILRGTCTFASKLENVRQAGAVAAVVYADPVRNDPFVMSVGGATLPAEMIGNADGLTIKQALASGTLDATLRFDKVPVELAANRLSSFSSAGPSVDTGIKPDVMAVGTNFYTATQTLDSAGSMYNSSGFTQADGTSFSSPVVAGAAAVLKSVRPGLSVDDYRSLLINTAGTVQTSAGDSARIQQQGAGLLDLDAAVRSTATVYPTSLSFGAQAGPGQTNRVLTLKNQGAASETFVISANARSGNVTPAIGQNVVELAPGASAEIALGWTDTGLSPGSYEGMLNIAGVASGTQLNVPYWYASTNYEPAHISVMHNVDSARRRSIQRDAILFRLTDASGVALAGASPQVVAVSGGGTVRRVASYDSEVPGMYGIDLQMGASAGTNVFRIEAGNVTLDVAIEGF